MTPEQFEAQLRADGFTEIERQDIAPRPGKGRHRHTFAIRGLVLEGAFIVRQDEADVTYGPGQVFSVDLGELHDEWIGGEGAKVVIGRRFASSPPDARGAPTAPNQ